MATYTKRLKTIDVYFMFSQESVPTIVSDTAEDMIASRMLADFLAGRDIMVVRYVATAEGSKPMPLIIPFHAVRYIAVTEQNTEVSRPDPYGCGGGMIEDTMCFEATSETSADVEVMIQNVEYLTTVAIRGGEGSEEAVVGEVVRLDAGVVSEEIGAFIRSTLAQLSVEELYNHIESNDCITL